MSRFIFLLTVVLLLSSCSNIFYDYRDAQSNNIIILPHDYRLFSSDGKINYVSKKQDNSPTVIQSDITQIGWNEDYIVYKRVDVGDKSKWGIFNMGDSTNQTFTSDADLNNHLKKLKIDSIKLSDISDLLDQKLDQRK